MSFDSTLSVRLATEADLIRALEIYATARKFMRLHGNETQWADWYPSEEILLNDIAQGALYCIFDKKDPDCVCGLFALIDGDDPTYAKIFEGSWKIDAPYGTIHRIASDGTHRGIFSTAIRYAQKTHDHLRIDTHRDNGPMLHNIEKWGFVYCGIIYIEDGTPRVAFEWTKPSD